MFLCEGKFCKDHLTKASIEEWQEFREKVTDRWKQAIISKDCPDLDANLCGKRVVSESENLILVEDA